MRSTGSREPGSEAHGLSPGVAALLDARVAIAGAPGRRGTESLNVAVATGILTYEWLKADYRSI